MTLSATVASQLRSVQPSHNGTMAYYPCRVWLTDGSVRERVYVVDAQQFERSWGLIERLTIPPAQVAAVEESPERLPPTIANLIYAAGESGMGYCRFTLGFRDGARQEYVTGNAVDFLAYPAGQSPATVVRVWAHRGADAGSFGGLEYEWCPVDGLPLAT